MDKTVETVCEQCGNTLQIPRELTVFSCVYCGCRMTRDARTREGLEAAAYFRRTVLSAVSEHTNMERFLTGAEFTPAFDAYEKDIAETVRQLDLAVSLGCLSAQDAAEAFLGQLEERWKGSKKLQDADKFTVAVFFIPAVRRLALPVSEDFCRQFHGLWMQRYPKSPFSVGDYDSIINGFQKKFLGLCFITTAVCLDSGKPDNCPELTAFRRFRDGYLRSCPDGEALIAEYYSIAPKIVARIELSEHSRQRYGEIRRAYLEPCYEALQAGDPGRCKTLYCAMVRKLEQEYL